MWPTLKALSAREFDVLRIKHNAKFGERPPRLLCISDSIGRSKARDAVGVGQCLTTSNYFFHTGKCRRLLGVEELFMQGMCFAPLSPEGWDPAAMDVHSFLYRRHNNRLLAHLAGNAFNTWCFAATLISTLRLHAELHTCSSVVGPTVLCKSQSDSDSDSDSASDLLDDIWRPS